MSISDPLTIAAKAPTPVLDFAVTDRSKPFQADRSDKGGEYSLSISHTNAKNGAKRHYIKVSQRKLVISPTSGFSSYHTGTVSIAISVPPYGFTTVDMTALETLLEDIVSTATMAKILNSES